MSKKSKKKPNGKDGWLSLPTTVLESAGYKSRTYRIGLLTGQGIGGLVLLGGIILSLLGISGSIEWLVEAVGITSKLTNASPGIVIAMIGAAILWRYKPHVSHETTFDRQNVSPSSLMVFGRSSESSTHRVRQTGPAVMTERVTYREEQRGMDGAPENRSMAGRIQHGEVQIHKKDV
jgi:hypothetical protein